MNRTSKHTVYKQPERLFRDSSIDLSNPPSIIVKILMGALKACDTQNTSRLSMSDIMHAANVSRGTLYKYFESKEQVLLALTEFLTLEFEKGLQSSANSETDPVKKFRAILSWHDHFSSIESLDSLILSEPMFFLGFLRDNFGRHIDAMVDALTPCFDHFDKMRGRPLDRKFLCELLLRTQQSRVLQPTGTHWQDAYAHSIIGFENMLAAPADYSRH